MKDYGYKNVYEHADEKKGSLALRSIVIFRHYEQADSYMENPNTRKPGSARQVGVRNEPQQIVARKALGFTKNVHPNLRGRIFNRLESCIIT